MGSRVLNLKRELTWKDFGKPRQGVPQPGTFVAAQTFATYEHDIEPEGVPGSRTLRLKDDVVIRIRLVPAKTWVLAWTLAQPLAFRNQILHHEQGHYDLVALFSRDLFDDLMGLRTKTYDSPAAFEQDIKKAMERYDKPLVEIHPRYDHETGRGQLRAAQKKWDGYIQKAFTTNRTPAVKGCDGENLRVPLLDVLRGAGITF